MKSRNVLIASAAAVTMLAAGCSGGSGGGAAQLKLEKTNIVVNAFPAIDSAGLYIAQDQGLFAAQGLHVKIVPVPVNAAPPSTCAPWRAARRLNQCVGGHHSAV